MPKVKYFDTVEQAWEHVHSLTDDDPYCDNTRFAWLDDPAAVKVYEQQEQHGCCGFVDLLVIIGTRPALIGLNFGH